MDILIGSGVVFCILAIVGLMIIFFIISFFMPSFRRGPRTPFIRTGRFFNRPPGGPSSSGGQIGSHPTNSGGQVGSRSWSRGGTKGGGKR